VAALQGCERGLLAPSTLHLFWDLFGALAGSGMAIYADVGIYPVVRWGVERAAARGVPAHGFAHHDPESLRRRLKLDARRGWRPLVVTDGLCPGCGGPAPVVEYLECARDYGGILILDDTQALGILGHSPDADGPYGKGGGGVLRWSNVAGPDVLVGSSLAKGFGAPVAALTGSEKMISFFQSKSETRAHTSPPSSAVINAARRALELNDWEGDDLRMRLAGLVSRFRRQIRKAGFVTTGGLFPFQTLGRTKGLDATTLYKRLLGDGVKTILHQARNGDDARISFIITARHTPGDISRAVEALARVARNARTRSIKPRGG
jgi:8-amino-7-oxononanoate synthase